MSKPFSIRYTEQSYWDSWDFSQYSNMDYDSSPRLVSFYDTGTVKANGSVKKVTGKDHVEVYYECVAAIKKEYNDEFDQRESYWDIQTFCYVDWNKYYTGDPIPVEVLNFLKDFEQGPGSQSGGEGSNGRRSFFENSSQVPIRKETVINDYYKEQARQFIDQYINNNNLQPRKEPYLIKDHEGRVWEVTISNTMNGRNIYYSGPLQTNASPHMGIHGNSMQPMGITGQSMDGGLSEAAISFLKPYVMSTFQGAFSVAASTLEHSNAKTMEEAVAVIAKALENNPEIQYTILKQEFEKVMKMANVANANGLPQVAEGLEKNAVKMAMNRAVNRMDNMKAFAELDAVSKNKYLFAMADELTATCKALEAAGYVYTLMDIMKGLNDMGNGDKDASVRVNAAFVDLGVTVGTTIIGAAVEGAVGGSAGGPAGAAVGVGIGLIWGIANYVSLNITGKTVSTLAGEAIDDAVLNFVSDKHSVTGTFANRASGGMIDTKGNFNTDFTSWDQWWEKFGAKR